MLGLNTLMSKVAINIPKKKVAVLKYVKSLLNVIISNRWSHVL